LAQFMGLGHRPRRRFATVGAREGGLARALVLRHMNGR
jgi:hypothetical protein